jgi:hypothetical protein
LTITNLHRNTVPEETIEAIVARHRDPKIKECQDLFQECLNRYVGHRKARAEAGEDPRTLPSNEDIVVTAVQTLRKNGYTPEVIRTAFL